MMRFAMLGLAIATLACASTGVPEAPPTGETLTLHFDWPSGLTAEVEMEHGERQRSADGKINETEARHARFTMNVSEAPDGQLIRYENVRLEDPTTGRWTPRGDVGQALPSFVVAASGEFLRIDDVASLIARLEQSMAPMIEQLPPDSDEARALLHSLVSEEVLVARAKNDWDPLVGSWVGAELEVGAVYEGEDTGVVPLFGGMEIPLRFEVSILQWVSCDGENLLPRCVEIQYQSHPDPERVRGLFAEMFATLLPPGADVPDVESFDLRQAVHLITQPESLIPHYLQVLKNFEFSLALPDGTKQTAGKSEQTTHRFVYPR